MAGRIVDPSRRGDEHISRRLGVPTRRDLDRAQQTAERRQETHGIEVQNASAILSRAIHKLRFRGASASVVGDVLEVATGGPSVFASQTKSSGFPALSTTLQTLDSVALGPLAVGVIYDIEAEVHARLSVDTTGFARVYANIGADSSVIGEQTGSVGGERSCNATATKLGVLGDGTTTYTIRAKADMDTSTGTCASTHIRARAIPR